MATIKEIEQLSASELVDRIFYNPRSAWERNVREFALNLKTYTYSDPRSVTAFTELVGECFKEILKLSLLLGRTDETPT